MTRRTVRSPARQALRAATVVLLCATVLLTATPVPTPAVPESAAALQLTPAPAPDPAPVASGSALLIRSFSTAPKVVVAGKEFTLTLTISNHTTRRADDVQVTVGASTDPGSDMAAAGPATSLAVTGTGNTLRIGRIAPNSTATVTFTLAADPASRAGVHTVPIHVSYDSPGRAGQLTQSLGVLVTQLARLDVSTFEIPDTSVAGEPVEVLSEVMNTGTVGANGVAFSLTAEGSGEIAIEGGHLAVGTLEAGAFDSIEAIVTPSEAGEVGVTLAITYLDALGATHEISRVQTITVTPVDVPDEPTAGNEAGGGFFGTLAAFFRGLFGLGE